MRSVIRRSAARSASVTRSASPLYSMEIFPKKDIRSAPASFAIESIRGTNDIGFIVLLVHYRTKGILRLRSPSTRYAQDDNKELKATKTTSCNNRYGGGLCNQVQVWQE